MDRQHSHIWLPSHHHNHHHTVTGAEKARHKTASYVVLLDVAIEQSTKLIAAYPDKVVS